MPGDPLESAERLLAAAEQWRQRAERAQSQAAIHDRRDGLVIVDVDEQGRLSKVDIRAGWRRQLGVDGLAAVVRDAIQAATAARLSGWATAFSDDAASSRPPAGVPLPSGGPAEQVQRALAAAPPGDLRAGIAELTAIVNDLAAGVSQAQARLASVARATYVGHAGDGKAIVTVTGAGVEDVRYEQRWLAGAHESTIGRYTVSAFADAYRKAQATVEQAITGGRLGVVYQALHNPDDLAARLRPRN